jgi:hypothetical protein
MRDAGQNAFQSLAPRYANDRNRAAMISSLKTNHKIRRIDDLFWRAILDRATFADPLLPLFLDFIDKFNKKLINARGVFGNFQIFKNDLLRQLVASRKIKIAEIGCRSEFGCIRLTS